MLHQTLSKGWCRHGSGLLLGLIIRARRRLVEAQSDDSRRAWPKADRRRASGKRQIIEGVIGQLKDIFALERRAKILSGLLARLAAKVAAYTCAQTINASLGRPLRHLADMLT